MAGTTLSNKDLLDRSLRRLHLLLELDPQLRQSQPLPAALDTLLREGRSCAALMGLAFDLYAQRPAFGSRDYKIVRDDQGQHRLTYLPRFRTMSYADLGVAVTKMASGLVGDGLCHQGESLGVLGFASLDYVVTALACTYLGQTFIPLPFAATGDILDAVVDETNMSCLVCSLGQLAKLAPHLSRHPKVRSVIAIDMVEGDDQHQEMLTAFRTMLTRDLQVHTLADLEAIGEEYGPVAAVTGGDPLMTILYAPSGFGKVKATPFRESMWVQNWQQALHTQYPSLPLITVNAMPLSHPAGLLNMVRSLMQGGLTHFTLADDLSTLFDDIRLCRPTTLFLVPSVSDMIYRHYERMCYELSDNKLNPTSAAVSHEVMMQMRHTFLGDRLIYVSTGTAPTSTNVLDFIKRCFDVPVFTGYGSTEIAMGSFEGKITRDHISDYKLTDVPRMGYFVTDKPYPRGELRIKVRRAAPHPLKGPVDFQHLYDDEGFLKTGDIVEEIAPDYVVWIDRVTEPGKGDTMATTTSRRRSCEQIHGKDPNYVNADDLRIKQFMDEDEQWQAETRRETPIVAESQIVLLTGANGFLGRFLAMEILERLPAHGKLYALVRAIDDDAAHQRLFADFEQGDLAMHQRFQSLARDERLVVIAGDLRQDHLGLTQDMYGKLAKNLDTIIHAGAQVNQAFSYQQLFETNVLGSAEVIRLALHSRKKAVAYVSSLGPVSRMTRSRDVSEQETGKSLWHRRPVNSSYGAGYGTSKWAAEILLQDAHETFGLPVQVFRCSPILAHRQYDGQINVSDPLTRLLLSLVYTGIAPASFYGLAHDGHHRPHFDGVPADLVASSMATLALRPDTSYRHYHVSNDDWDDGVSLDSLVAWIATAGYPVRRVDKYDQWFEMFRERLKNLEDPLRANSAFPTIYQWEHPIDITRECRLETTEYRQAMNRQLSDVTTGFEVPHINEEMLNKWLADLRFLDLLDDPPMAERGEQAQPSWPATSDATQDLGIP